MNYQFTVELQHLLDFSFFVDVLRMTSQSKSLVLLNASERSSITLAPRIFVFIISILFEFLKIFQYLSWTFNN